MPVTIHFLNVGHGDCTIVEHDDGALTMIDINNVSEPDFQSRYELSEEYPARPTLGGVSGSGLLGSPPSGVLSALLGTPTYKELKQRGYGIETVCPLSFIEERHPSRRLHRYIQTHPDLDHMRGIASLMASPHSPINFWDTRHTKDPDLKEDDKADWETYQAIRSGVKEGLTVLRLNEGASGSLYNRNWDGHEGGHGIEILSPSSAVAVKAADAGKWNDLSYVLRIRHGTRSVILGGDAEDLAWNDIYERYGANLRCDVLKASHHGRDSGYHQKAVKAMSPLLTIVSVGKKPSTDASNKYRQYTRDDNVWSTRWKGTISVTMEDDGQITYVTDRGD